MIHFPKKERYDLQDLCDITAALRSDEGCPWDRVQTHESLRRCLQEETCEVLDAIDRADTAALCEELGDLLLQVVFHADLERGVFDMSDVCDGVVKKLLLRHPHVFGGDSSVGWEDIKRAEKHQRSTAEAMESVVRTLPALWRAEKLQKKALGDIARRETPDEMSAALHGRVDGLARAVRSGEGVSEALGELLFGAVAAARATDTDPEEALNTASDGFMRRFSALEEEISAKAGNISQLTLDEWNDLWNNKTR